MDRAKVELSLFPSGLCSDFQPADGVRPSHVEHAIEDGHANRRFGFLARKAWGSKARTDDGLVSSLTKSSIFARLEHCFMESPGEEYQSC